MINGTLHEVYLKSQNRNNRKQREVKKYVRMSQTLRQPTQPSISIKHESVSLYVAHSLAIEKPLKCLQ